MRGPTHHCICKYLRKMDTIIHIFQQNKTIYNQLELITNIMRWTINDCYVNTTTGVGLLLIKFAIFIVSLLVFPIFLERKTKRVKVDV